MNLTLTTMDRKAARTAYLEYRRALNTDLYEEDRIITKSYRALSQGHRLVNVRDAIHRAGENADGSPKLAIARADDEWCYYLRDTAGRLSFRPHRFGDRRNRVITFPDNTLRQWQSWNGMAYQGRSVVPIIPPPLRPKAMLHNYHILWEAEWQQVPVDPALLKRIEGDIYAVIAVWDLTEVERIALGLRREARA